MVGHDRSCVETIEERIAVNHVFAHRRLIAGAASLLVATLACSAPIASGGATPSETSEVAQAPTSTQVGVPPPATEVVTLEAGGTATAATAAPAPGVTPSGTSCLYNSSFVSDLSIPDGTQVQVGTSFTKTWRIKNSGCQEWPAGTTLIFVSGNQMSGPASVTVPDTAVGGTQDVSVNLTAPSPAGDFQGYWQLRTPSGIQFGDKVFVKIQSTAAPTATPTNQPPPPVAFDLSFDSKWQCSTFWRFGFKLTNTGTEAIQSISTTLKSSGSSSSTNTPFEQQPPVASPACLQAGLDSLAAGAARWISISMGTSDPGSGTDTVTVQACSADGQGGDCATKKLKFNY